MYIEGFEEFEECFTEPTEAELIIEKAKLDIASFFTDEIKGLLEKAKEAKSDLDKLKTDKAVISNQIDELKKQMENIEKYEMPKKYIDSFVYDATKGFVPGDEVWVVGSDTSEEQCRTCRGKKRVMIIDYEYNNTQKITCPTCNGRGTEYIHKKIPKKEKIESIQLTLCFYKNRVSYWTTECILLFGDCLSREVKNLFRTKDEALKYIEDGEKRKGAIG